MGREMPESAIVLFTLIDTPFFYANVHLIRVITHTADSKPSQFSSMSRR